MARYIKAVECAEIISEKLNIPLGDLVDIFAEIPTADVVPKSEVEELKGELAIAERHEKDARALFKDAVIQLQNARREVAREIFEEIEKIILDNTYPDFNREHKAVNIWKATTGYDAFYELKKKYTGDNKE